MAIINVDDAYILNETGAQVDKTTGIPFKDESLTDAEAAQARANIRAGGSNWNFLDNPFFTVNQRGFTTGTAGYVADRWGIFGGSPTVTRVSPYGFSVSASQGYNIQQRIDPDVANFLDGKTVTLSCIVDGVLYSKTGVLDINGGYQLTSVFGNGNDVFIFVGGAVPQVRFTHNIGAATHAYTVTAAKLELGTVSTLPNDAPPDYGQELAKCQRYFYRMTSIGSAYPFEMGFATSATNFRVVLPTHCSMHTPVQSVTMNGGNFYAYGNGVAASLTSVSYTGWVPNGIVVTFATSGLTQAAIYALMCNNASSYIDISCDL